MLKTSTSFDLPIDHVVIAVPKLSDAVELFQAEGFHVEYGGHNGPTHNALIFFKDGKYIELISLRSTWGKWCFKVLSLPWVLSLMARFDKHLKVRFIRWFTPCLGLQDWCLRCANLEDSVSKLQKHDHIITGVESFERVRPDGIVARWKLAATTSRSLPFLISDTTQVDVRVPFSEHCDHENGVIGFSKLTINRHNSDASEEKIGSFFKIFSGLNSFSTKVEVTNQAQQVALSLELESSNVVDGAVRGIIHSTMGLSIV